MSDLPLTAIGHKLTQLRNRFYDLGDDTGVMLCNNLADDLTIHLGSSDEPSDESHDETLPI